MEDHLWTIKYIQNDILHTIFNDLVSQCILKRENNKEISPENQNQVQEALYLRWFQNFDRES